MQYFLTAMVLTIIIGLFTLKPITNQQVTPIAKVSNITENDQPKIVNVAK